ncbi:site-specific DNA-methyltransferase [Bradyrhizobium liaoningense]|uniref:site-specific DNA-methyltransferase n=1 Tax=Bradyrhizobium liaoningense TaxID=43992 RepID=UPI001BACF169|nr:site-specific DNA-methyltransferase [Bradyrhizobium liaoningense]MBR0860102.1 site-specific DNA-methyltransferase [Bradyrhizobium liaoningense]
MGRNGGARLELTWIGKSDRPRLEPRILIEDADKSHHAATKRDEDIFDNMLIQGDNLLALKALEADYAGKVKCVFIDPPYNTGSAFEHYDDGLEHSLWLSLMRDRLELIRRLLSDDGSLWITIDDNEAHYLKVLCDEIFGRSNFITSVIWRKNYSPKSTARHFSEDHDYILVIAKNAEKWIPNPMPRTEKQDAAYKNPDNDPRGRWKPGDLSARNYYSKGLYPIKTPSGRIIPGPPNKNYWRVDEKKFWELDKDKRIWWGRDGGAIPQIKRFLAEVKEGVTPQTFWPHDDVGHTQEAKQESIELFAEKAFATPKPERLLHRILSLATNPKDLVLDSFAGSGTTGAVAHKMGRRWIMAEQGEHAVTHMVPRLRKVVDGKDEGGVTGATGWQGGGGFRFYHLAPSLLEKDKWGNWVIAKTYNAAMLAEAMCRHMGFTYQPSQDVVEYWRHGHSSERDFIFVTTASLTHDQLRAISHDVGTDRTLLICCKAFNARLEDFENLTVRKIPHSILSRCEWGRDDYSLEIAELPTREPGDGTGSKDPSGSASNGRKRGRGKAADIQPTLFGDGEA